MRKCIFSICEGRSSSDIVMLKSTPDADGNISYYEVTLSEGHHDKSGKLETLLCTQHDVTDEQLRKGVVEKTLMRFHTVFNSSLIDMIFYDKNGVLRDINEKACESFNIHDRQFAINGRFLLQNNPMYTGIDFDKLENTRTTSLVDFGDYTDKIYQTEELGLKGKMYYESTINPIRNEKGEIFHKSYAFLFKSAVKRL